MGFANRINYSQLVLFCVINNFIFLLVFVWLQVGFFGFSFGWGV